MTMITQTKASHSSITSQKNELRTRISGVLKDIDNLMGHSNARTWKTSNEAEAKKTVFGKWQSNLRVLRNQIPEVRHEDVRTFSKEIEQIEKLVRIANTKGHTQAVAEHFRLEVYDLMRQASPFLKDGGKVSHATEILDELQYLKGKLAQPHPADLGDTLFKVEDLKKQLSVLAGNGSRKFEHMQPLTG